MIKAQVGGNLVIILLTTLLILWSLNSKWSSFVEILMGEELHNSGKKIRYHGRCWHCTFLLIHLFISTKTRKLTGFTFHADELPIGEWCHPQALQVKVFVALSLTRNQRVTRAFTDLQQSKEQWVSNFGRHQNSPGGSVTTQSTGFLSCSFWFSRCGGGGKEYAFTSILTMLMLGSLALTVRTTELDNYFQTQYGIV